MLTSTDPRRRLARLLTTVAVVSGMITPATVLSSGIASAEAGDPTPAVYSIADLGAPEDSVPYAINDGGTAVGAMPNGNAFRSRDHVLDDLGAGTAQALSEFGEVFGDGHGTGSGGTAFAVTPDGRIAAGGAFEPGVIPAAYGTGTTMPGVWSKATGWLSLYGHGCRLPSMATGRAFGINASGVLVGQALVGSFPDSVSGTAFACTPDPAHPGEYIVSNLAPFSGPYTGAFAINVDGTIVGKVDNEARLWDSTDPNSYQSLGPNPEDHAPTTGSSQSGAYAINDHGDVVGAYGPVVTNKFLDVGDTRQRAFIWTQSGGMRDLTDLIPADSGWTLHAAYDINNSGQIVGWGSVGGEVHAFVLTPGSDVNVVAERIMVTQAIQNERNLDLLVAGKATYAIVRAHAEGGDVVGVDAVLRGYRNGQLLGTLDPVGPPVTVRTVPWLDRANHSFVFALDPSWTTEGSLSLQATLNPGFDVEEFDYDDNTTPRAYVKFSASPPLSVVVIDAHYEGEPAPTVQAGAVAYDAAAATLRRMLPTGALRISHHPVPIAIARVENPVDQCGAVVAELHRVRLSMQLDDRTLLYAQLGLRPDGTTPYSHRDESGVLKDEGVAGCSYVPDMVATGWTGQSAPEIAAHELIHAIGRNHVPYCNATGSDNPAYPDPEADGRIYAGSLHRARLPVGSVDLGFDGTRLLPWWSGQDIMTYCDLWWPSDYTYENVYRLLPQVGSGRPRNSLARAVSIVGQIDDVTATAEFTATEYEPESPTPAPLPGPYHLEFYDGATKLADVPFTPSIEGPHDTSGGEPPRALINEIVALPAGTDRIAVYDDRAAREIGSSPFGGTAPTVSWASPNDGASLPAAGSLTLAWTSHDDDGDPLTHTLLYRPDGSQPWTVLANGVSGSSTIVDPAALDGSANGTLRVVASDGSHLAHADLTALQVSAKPPVVHLGSPAAGTTITTDQSVELSATAHTLSGQQLDASAFVWTSDRDGTLGSGPIVVTGGLSVGTHHIEVEVTGPDGASATESTTVHVAASGQTPSRLAVSYDRLSFTGDTTTSSPPAQTLEVYDESGGAIDWTAVSDDPRVTVSPASGTTATDIAVSVDTGSLHAGEDIDSTVTVRRADGAEPPIMIRVHAASSGATGTVSPATVDFGRRALGTSGSPRPVTFTYRGAGSMTLGAAELAGPSPNEYDLSNDGCSNATLTSGQSCTVSVSYVPTDAGRRPAYLVLSDSDSDARWFASLTGIAAVSFTSSVVAWGNNDNGQLGSITANCEPGGSQYGELYVPRPCSSVPIPVPGLSDVVQVAAGADSLEIGGSQGSHSLALKTDGTVWSWGSNKGGELGNGTMDSSNLGFYNPIPHPTPGQVVGLTDVTAIAAGRHVSMALRGDGTVWMWGLGTLGDGTGQMSTTPVQVKGLNGVGFLTDVVEIAVDGQYGTAFALKSDGTVWGWGYNDQGMAGTGSAVPTYVLTPTQVVGAGGQGKLTGVVSIAARAALKADGTVWTWGPQDGLGTYIYPRTWTASPVQVTTGLTSPPLTGIAAVTSGGSERFALGQDGQVWAWSGGRFRYRDPQWGVVADPWVDLGVAKISYYPTFAQPVVAPGGLGQFGGVATLSAAAAMTSDGALWGWGFNAYGQAGDGTLATTTAPRRVVGVGGTGTLDDVVEIAGGYDHRLAIVSAGTGAPSTLSAGDPVSLTGGAGETLDEDVGSFDDTGASKAFDFSASIAWGDGTTDSAAVVSGPDGGPYQVRGKHAYRAAGTYDLTVDVVGRNGDSVTTTGTVTVAASSLTPLAGGVVTFVAGAPAEQALGGFESSNPTSTEATFTATVDWGDGSGVESAIVAGSPGGPFTVVGEHTYRRAGAYPIVLHVVGDDDAEAAMTATANVLPAALTVRSTYGRDVEAGTAFVGPLAAFDDGNPLASPSDYTAVIEWGDGTTTAGVVEGSTGGPWTVVGNHTYAALDPSSVVIALHGPAGASVSATTTLMSRPPRLRMEASASPASGGVPLETTFVYDLHNDGSGPLLFVEVSGTLCGGVAYATGDDGDEALEPDETWRFSCTHVFTMPGTFADVAWATADGLTGVPVRTANAETVVRVGDIVPPIVTVTGVADGATYDAGAVPIAGCSTIDPAPSSGIAIEATSVTTGGPTSFTVTCSGAVDVAGNAGNTAVARYTVRTRAFVFSGFKPPVDDPPTVNRVKAGSAVPVKFSLGGDRGLDIFATGFPGSRQVTCGSTSDVDTIEQTANAGSSSLSYDPQTDVYSYVWKTQAGWKNTCRQLVLTFIDGSTARADFMFTK